MMHPTRLALFFSALAACACASSPPEVRAVDADRYGAGIVAFVAAGDDASASQLRPVLDAFAADIAEAGLGRAADAATSEALRQACGHLSVEQWSTCFDAHGERAGVDHVVVLGGKARERGGAELFSMFVSVGRPGGVYRQYAGPGASVREVASLWVRSLGLGEAYRETLCGQGIGPGCGDALPDK